MTSDELPMRLGQRLRRRTAQATRLFHTVRYLKPVQIYGRALAQINWAQVDGRPAPPARQREGQWVPTPSRPACLRDGWRVRFLNEDGEIAQPWQWNNPEKSKLWLYNLHYFDDLVAPADGPRTAMQRQLITRWIAENPPPAGNGWEPYPLSLRIVNWIRWALAGNELKPEWRDSLAVQVRYLLQRIEWHLLGNHLWANAKALVFAGVFFTGQEAQDWRKSGLEILTRQLPEQILTDGGHFELSPMYHVIITQDLLDLINLVQTCPAVIPQEFVDILQEQALKMRQWLLAMAHPDGEISFFNDAAFAIACHPNQIEDYAARLNQIPCPGPFDGLTQLRQSGYMRAQRDDFVALIDVARVGPDYLPGHAHADTLSFELSLFDHRVIVNTGTSVYGLGPDRLWQRSTRSHSTVEIDCKNSSEVWGGFRVARRARPYDLDAGETEDGMIVVRCSHDGYRRLPGQVVHNREWRFASRSFTVTDRIKGYHQRAVARFYLHPSINVEIDEGNGRLILADGKQVHWQCIGGIAKMQPSSWHPEFGISEPNQCLEVILQGNDITTTFSW